MEALVPPALYLQFDSFFFGHQSLLWRFANQLIRNFFKFKFFHLLFLKTAYKKPQIKGKLCNHCHV